MARKPKADGAPTMGRPSEFSQAVAEEICERLAKGESLRSITADQEGGWLPSETTVRRWLARGEAEKEGAFADFRRQYAHARDAQADTKFEQAWEIAQAATTENVQVARLQIDTIKWQASKLSPKRYGDKIDVNHTGEVVQRHDLSRYSPDDLDALEKLVAKASDAPGDQGGESPPRPDRVH